MPTIQKQLDDIKDENKDSIIVVRKSGTEKLIRVMVETKDLQLAKKLLNTIETPIANRITK